MTLQEVWETAVHWTQTTEIVRVLTTIAVLGACVVVSRSLEHRLNRTANEQNVVGSVLDTARKRFVHLKNLVWVTGVLIVITIWASKIAGIVLSLAAVAGASLIVSKELLMCMLGYVYLMGSRAYQVGDYVEVNNLRGKVVDIDIFATTLAENSLANQLTGKTLTMPNGMLLGNSIRNVSATGEFIINMQQFYLPIEADVELAEEVVLRVTQEVNGSWQGAINRHLTKLEMRNLVDIPSARPKALWVAVDAKTHGLVVRYGCPANQRVNAEQDVYRKFWAEYNRLVDMKKSLKDPMDVKSLRL